MWDPCFIKKRKGSLRRNISRLSGTVGGGIREGEGTGNVPVPRVKGGGKRQRIFWVGLLSHCQGLGLLGVGGKGLTTI